MTRRIAAALSLALGFALSLSTSARAGDPSHVFSDNFNDGHAGAWSFGLGNVCPQPYFAEHASAGIQGDSPHRYIAYNSLDGFFENHADYLNLAELYEDFGAPMEPDTIDLGAGDETNYATCGTCVLVYVNVDFEALTVGSYYFQRSGEFDITTLDPQIGGIFAGTINAVLEEVTIDTETFESTPVPNGCVMGLVNFSFSKEILDAN